MGEGSPGYAYCNADCGDDPGLEDKTAKIAYDRCEQLFVKALQDDKVRRDSCNALYEEHKDGPYNKSLICFMQNIHKANFTSIYMIY